MNKKVILAHAEDEENIAVLLQGPLEKAGYRVKHRGTVLVGESYTREFKKYLDQHFPVVVCGTVKACGTGWVGRIVDAAQARDISVFPLKLEATADLSRHIPSDLKIIDCSGTNLEAGIKQLLAALQKYYPLDDPDLRLTQEVNLKPAFHLDNVTPETSYSQEVIAAYRERLRIEVLEKYPTSLRHDLFLDKMNLRVGGKLTLTGVLLFTESPNRYSPSAITKCSVYGGAVISGIDSRKKANFGGPVQQQMDLAYNFVRMNVDRKEHRDPDRTDLQDVYRYPVFCLREVIANALCHRDYADGSRSVDIRVFDNRIEIGSPGSWFGRRLVDGQEYRLNELEGHSQLRNPTLAHAIFAISRFEGRGEGIPTSIEDCQQRFASMPIVVERDGYVTVTVFPSGNWSSTDLSLEHVSIARLPITGGNLFGRERELRQLDEAWASKDTRLLSLVAWGGVGKSTLANHWLAQLAQDDYRGAARVYGWSFFSQGTTDRAVFADQFIESALTWFGDPAPNKGSPWDRGERLGRLVGAQRTLLVLDGLEPLQYPPGPDEGRLKDQALQALLRQLAVHNEGLCLISTRLAVTDLQAAEGGATRTIELENLSPEAGAQVLRVQGVKGPQAELEKAASEFGGHSLTLTLLGSYLSDVHKGDVRRRDQVGNLEENAQMGGPARRMMAPYEEWFGDGPELAVLRLLGLFNHPADKDALATLRAGPVVPGLNDTLLGLSEAEWQRVLARLRRAKILAEANPNQPEMLDAHPLVREHFGRRLKQQHPTAWREGHDRLYEHLKATAKKFPVTIEEMAPLYEAVAHGCEAGRHQNALDQVYWQRILQGTRDFNITEHGSPGAGLAALTGFFEIPWSKPIHGLTSNARAFVLNEAGFCLRSLGRLEEAVGPVQGGLAVHLSKKDFLSAATDASNLAELLLNIGDLSRARTYAEQSVEMAEIGGDDLLLIAVKTTLADTLHQAGSLAQAEADFIKAEKMHEASRLGGPYLTSFPGFRYCDFLLGQGKHREVQERLKRLSKEQEPLLLDSALQNLALGRSHLIEAIHKGNRDFGKATDPLVRAVEELRQAGTLHHLPRGLVARAELYRLTDQFEQAQADLDEAMGIATRGSMGLFQTDCHLEFARLYLARGEREKAREHWTTAKGMIERMGYNRREKDLKEIEEQTLST